MTSAIAAEAPRSARRCRRSRSRREICRAEGRARAASTAALRRRRPSPAGPVRSRDKLLYIPSRGRTTTTDGRDLSGPALSAAKNHPAKPDVLRRIGEERHEACPFEGDGETTLMMGARPGLPAGLDLRAVRQVPAQATHVLVVDVLHLVDAKLANAPPRRIAAAAAAARRPTGPGPLTGPREGSWARALWPGRHTLGWTRTRRRLGGRWRLLRCWRRWCWYLVFAQMRSSFCS